MGRQVRAAVLLFFACLALVSLAGAAAQEKASARYDGHWWLSITTHEQYGFLNGFTDCYDYEYKGPDRYIDYDADQRLITAFYAKNASQQTLSVPEVLHGFRASLTQKPRSWRRAGKRQARLLRRALLEAYMDPSRLQERLKSGALE